MQGWFQNHMFFSSKIMLSGRFSSFVFLSLGHGIFSMKYLIRKIICILLNRKTIFAKKKEFIKHIKMKIIRCRTLLGSPIISKEKFGLAKAQQPNCSAIPSEKPDHSLIFGQPHL
jgi:hypothetical protein